MLQLDPFSGHHFVFGGRRGDMLKCLFWDTQGLVLYARRLEQGRFVWPQAREGSVSLTPIQLSMLLESMTGGCPGHMAAGDGGIAPAFGLPPSPLCP